MCITLQTEDLTWCCLGVIGYYYNLWGRQDKVTSSDVSRQVWGIWEMEAGKGKGEPLSDHQGLGVGLTTEQVRELMWVRGA